MAYYYSIRGWLEVDHENFLQIAETLKFLQSNYSESAKFKLYMKGWCWQDNPINWSRYIFYGADVTVEGLNLLENVLNKIIGMRLKISGYFHAQGEDGDKSFAYQIVDDILSIKETSVLIDVT